MPVDSGRRTGGAAPLRVTLDSHAHGVVTASITGALDLTSTAHLDAELSGALAAGPCRRLVLDLAGVDTLDSTGLRALWTIRQATRQAGAQLVLRRPSVAVMHVLHATGLTAQFELA